LEILKIKTMANKEATVELYDLSSRFGKGGFSGSEKKEGDGSEPAIKKIGVSIRAEIVSGSESINPDGFSEIRLRNIGSDNAKIFDVIPLNPSDPEWALKEDYFCKIIDKVRITFAGISADRQILVTKIYKDEL
jgi:hypothetical protein